MASKSTAVVLLAAFVMLAAASSAIAQAPACPGGLEEAIKMEPYNYDELISGLSNLSTLAAAQCVCDALLSSGLAGENAEVATSGVEAILKNAFAVLPMEDDLPEGFTCSPPDTA